MCVAIYKAIGLSLDEKTLRACFNSNPDGAGFAYIENETGELRIQKFMEFKPFLAAYQEKEELYRDSSPFLVHFRIKTHGKKDIDNCHPFQIDADHVFIHNGVIRNVPDCPEKKRSDTRMFKELVLRNLPEGWFSNKAIKSLIEEYIGSYSKLAIMNREGVVELYNEKSGSWIDGVWFSNTHWQSRRDFSSYKHADNCLVCGIGIKNNIYSNTQNVSFCCLKHKEEFFAPGYKGTLYHDLCEMCDRTARITVWHDGTTYKYCSDSCKNIHKKQLEKEAQDRKNRINQTIQTVQCGYCCEHVIIETALELEVQYGATKLTEYICLDCIPNAIKYGFIDDTEELQNTIKDMEADLKVGLL